MNSYVVITSIKGNKKSQIWDASNPLPIGNPFQYIIEKTEKGVRVRNLSKELGEVHGNSFQEFTEETLKKGAEIDISPISLTIRSAKALPPAYTSSDRNTDGILTAFACAGDWVLSSEFIHSTYKGRAKKQDIFAIKKGSKLFDCKALTDDVVVNTQGTDKLLKKGESIQLSPEQWISTVVAYGHFSWRFRTVAPMGAATKTKKSIFEVELEKEYQWFKKALVATAVAFGLILVIAWLWPVQKEEELVPPQVAKIIMTKLPKSEAAAPAQVPVAAQNAPQKVKDSAVVQAFRAKALNNAVSGLLKGGMTKLLAQSDFVAGSRQTDSARRLFDAKSDALKATSPDTSAIANKNVNVASLGGSSAKGYAKGDHAAVSGQGSSFVSMDIGNASVEEGLTKDEVGEVIHRHLSEVRYCYESAMLRTPDIEGKLVINFTIGGSGVVKSSEIKSSTLPDPRLDDCILRRLVTWKFPQTKGGIDVAVSYPFIFKTLGR